MITVVVPVYNKQAKLPRCIDSLRRQTETDFECVLVDDGSTDESAKICESAHLEDLRFRVIHKCNGGLSEARNYGVKAARGEYLTFVDADDFVGEDYLKNLLSAMVASGADIATMPLNTIGCSECPNQISEASSIVQEPFDLLSAEEALFEVLYGGRISISACAKLYRSELIKRLFFPVGKLYEDVCYSCSVISKAGKVAALHTSQYHYVMNDDSITHNTDERVFDRFDLALDAKKLIDRMGNKDLSTAANRYCVYHGLSVLRSSYPKNENTSYKEDMVRTYIKRNGRAVLCDENAPKRDKVALLLLGLGLPLYRLAWGCYAALSDIKRRVGRQR